MASRKLGKVGNLGNLEKFSYFRVFLFPSFQFCPTAKIGNTDLKISEKNVRGFRVFDLAHQQQATRREIKWEQLQLTLNNSKSEVGQGTATHILMIGSCP